MIEIMQEQPLEDRLEFERREFAVKIHKLKYDLENHIGYDDKTFMGRFVDSPIGQWIMERIEHNLGKYTEKYE